MRFPWFKKKPVQAEQGQAHAQLAVVHIADVCNLACLFCLERDDRGGAREPPLTEVRETLAGLRDSGASDVVFMGAETFLRKDAVDVIRTARELGFRHIKVATNGTPISRPRYLRELADAGLNAIEISIHGATAEVVDRIAGIPHTFERQARALDELAAIRSIDVTLNTVICRENADSIAEIVAYVRQKLGPDRPIRCKLIFTHLLGCAWQEARDKGPLRYGEVDFTALGDRLEADGEQFFLDNVPLCQLGRHAIRSLKLKAFSANETYFDRAVEANTYRATGYQLSGQVWPRDPCEACTLRPLCQGVEEQYTRLAGRTELRTSNAPAVDVLRDALKLHGRDPKHAEARLEALRREPRPHGVVPPLKPGVVRLTHEGIAEPLELRIEPTQADRPCYKRTPRFDLAYRPWNEGNATADPQVKLALAQVVEVLTRADTTGADINDARAQVAGQTLDGWEGVAG